MTTDDGDNLLVVQSKNKFVRENIKYEYVGGFYIIYHTIFLLRREP